MIVGSKKFLNDPRVASLNDGDVCIEQDFTDAMLLTNMNEVQSSGFGGAGGKKLAQKDILQNISLSMMQLFCWIFIASCQIPQCRKAEWCIFICSNLSRN